MAIPLPTPAKCRADSPPQPASDRRSSTMVDEKIITKALAAPPMARKTGNAGRICVSPIAAVVSPLAASAPSNHKRRDPASLGIAASKAPNR